MTEQRNFSDLIRALTFGAAYNNPKAVSEQIETTKARWEEEARVRTGDDPDKELKEMLGLLNGMR
jgi:hypothetical protein